MFINHLYFLWAVPFHYQWFSPCFFVKFLWALRIPICYTWQILICSCHLILPQFFLHTKLLHFPVVKRTHLFMMCEVLWKNIRFIFSPTPNYWQEGLITEASPLYWRVLSVPIAEKRTPFFLGWMDCRSVLQQRWDRRPFARWILVGISWWGQGCSLGSKQWWIQGVGRSLNTAHLSSEFILIPYSWCFTICRQASLPEIS